jgi:hypothetical protein
MQKVEESNSTDVHFYSNFFWKEFEPKAFKLAKQVLYHLSHDPAFVCFSYFSGRSHIFSRGQLPIQGLPQIWDYRHEPAGSILKHYSIWI